MVHDIYKRTSARFYRELGSSQYWIEQKKGSSLLEYFASFCIISLTCWVFIKLYRMISRSCPVVIKRYLVWKTFFRAENRGTSLLIKLLEMDPYFFLTNFIRGIYDFTQQHKRVHWIPEWKHWQENPTVWRGSINSIAVHTCGKIAGRKLQQVPLDPWGVPGQDGWGWERPGMVEMSLPRWHWMGSGVCSNQNHSTWQF